MPKILELEIAHFKIMKTYKVEKYEMKKHIKIILMGTAFHHTYGIAIARYTNSKNNAKQ